MKRRWSVRLAREEDAPAIEILIRVSARVLQSSHYSEAQIEGALGSVFGVDHQLLSDRTYFVAEHKGQIVGCGGWSKRKTLFGGDAMKTEMDIELDPKRDSAMIRAFLFIPHGRVVASAAQSWNVVRRQFSLPVFALLNL